MTEGEENNNSIQNIETSVLIVFLILFIILFIIWIVIISLIIKAIWSILNKKGKKTSADFIWVIILFLLLLIILGVIKI